MLCGSLCLWVSYARNSLTPEFTRGEKEVVEEREVDRDIAKDDDARENRMRVWRGSAKPRHIHLEREITARVQVWSVIELERCENRRQELRAGKIPKEMADVIDTRAVERLEGVARKNDKAKPLAAPREHKPSRRHDQVDQRDHKEKFCGAETVPAWLTRHVRVVNRVQAQPDQAQSKQNRDIAAIFLPVGRQNAIPPRPI